MSYTGGGETGGRAALTHFLPYLRAQPSLQGKEKVIADHLLGKVRGIARIEGVDGLDWLLSQLETQSYVNDDLSFLRFGMELTNSPELGALILTAQAEVTATNGRLRSAWSSALSHLRAFDLTTGVRVDEEGVVVPAPTDDGYKKLEGFVAAEPQLALKEPALARELSERISTRKLRAAILAQVQSVNPVELEVILVELAGLVQGTAPAAEEAALDAAAKEELAQRRSRSRWGNLRWVESLLDSQIVTKNERLATLRMLWVTYLSGEENAKLWAGLPTAFRESYIGRLQGGSKQPVTREKPTGVGD